MLVIRRSFATRRATKSAVRRRGNAGEYGVRMTRVNPISTSASLMEVFKSRHTAELPKTDFYTWISEKAEENPMKDAIICGASHRKLTFRDVMDQAKQLGLSLQQRGYRQGDMAAILAPNIPEYVVTMIGCAYAGMAITLVNPLNQANEVEEQLRTTKAVVFFVFAPFAKVAFAAKSAVPKVRELYLYGVPLKYSKMNSVIDLYVKLFHGNAVGWLFDELINPESRKRKDIMRTPWLAEPIKYRPDKDLFLVPYSSGTTGPPKAACHTQASFMAYISKIEAFPSIANSGVGVNLHILPMFHIFGSLVSFLLLRLGSTNVTNPLFKKSLYLSSIEKYKADLLCVVPPIVSFLASDPDAYTKRKHDISCVKFIFSGGAPLALALAEKFHARYPDVWIMQGYGATEGLVSATEDRDTPFDSVGRLMPDCQLKIIDTQTQEMCSRNQPGELYVLTDSAFYGYLNNKEATAEAFEYDDDAHKWLRTGDIGYLDDNDNLFIVDRLKEMIKYKGHQVSPVEVEATLLEMSGVADAAVASIPHESFGEVPMAFVVRKNDSEITEDQVKAFIVETMAYQNHLRGGVIFIEKIPKSRIGKILRAELRKMVKEKIEAGELKQG